MEKMVGSWHDLRIGDQVRLVAWPNELHKSKMHADTQELYEWLIDTQSVLTIVDIDATGLPYGHVRRVVNGVEQSEYLALNHGGLQWASAGSPDSLDPPKNE